MAGHTALGYFLAVGVSGALGGVALVPALVGLLLWVVLLNGGTLAINSAYDRDEGDIGYLRSPPPVPRHLALFSFLLMALGQLLALRLPSGFAIAYGACFGMSLLYSVPPVRLKAVAGLDWVINMIGFGTLTPYAGYASTGRPVTAAHALVLLSFLPLFASLYPLTQLYQFEEDRQRGDRTLALILGMRRSLLVAAGAALVAFALLGWAAVRSAWAFSGADLFRWAGLVLAAGGWAWVLGRWLARYPRMTPADHQTGMYAALGAWAVTDVVVILGWGLYT
jgi:4-hydroxybenzoate polyprenyltransferase